MVACEVRQVVTAMEVVVGLGGCISLLARLASATAPLPGREDSTVAFQVEGGPESACRRLVR